MVVTEAQARKKLSRVVELIRVNKGYDALEKNEEGNFAFVRRMPDKLIVGHFAGCTGIVVLDDRNEGGVTQLSIPLAGAAYQGGSSKRVGKFVTLITHVFE